MRKAYDEDEGAIERYTEMTGAETRLKLVRQAKRQIIRQIITPPPGTI